MSLHSPTRWITIVFILSSVSRAVIGIGCFVCKSNTTNALTACSDRFSTVTNTSLNDNTNVSYQNPCWAYRENRTGLFPADHCLKIKGQRDFDDGTSEYVYIRTCGLDSGSTTSDTEIVRQSHCGTLILNGTTYSGCLQSCDTDGCNRSLRFQSSLLLIFIAIFMVIVLVTLQ